MDAMRVESGVGLGLYRYFKYKFMFLQVEMLRKYREKFRKTANRRCAAFVGGAGCYRGKC